MAEVEALSMFLKTATDKPVIGIKLADPLQSITTIFASLVAGKAFWTTNDQIIEKTESVVLENVFIMEEALYSQGISSVVDAFDFEEEIPADRPFCWTTSSGSLATPKITEHSYYSLMEDTLRQIKVHQIGSEDRIDIISSLSFSASLSSIFPALFSGASLHIYDNSSIAITGIYKFWKDERITMTTLIPTVFRSLLKYEYDFKSLDIRFICIGGEPVLISDIALFQEKFPSYSILQVSVASSEARGIAEYITGTEEPVPAHEIPYAPVAEKKISIVDKQGVPLPDGETGLIAITSKVIGARYIQGPSNFAISGTGEQRFISDDSGTLSEGKLRLTPRTQRRLKHKGGFIDLDQVEHTTLKMEGIRECHVDLSQSDTTLRIFIYTLLHKPFVRQSLNSTLKTSSFHLYIVKQTLPRTHSGKIDMPLLQQLVKPDCNAEYSKEDLEYYEHWHHIFPSETAFEGKHFFTDLGGDSIAATQLATQLSKAFDVEFDPSVIYLHPYYEELSNYIKNARPFSFKKIGDYKSGRPNILLFPTLQGLHEYYLPIVDQIKDRYNFFLILYPKRLDRQYESPANIAKKCAALLNESNYHFSCFMGYSFSGYLAYWTAHYYNKQSGVILLDSHTYKRQTKAENLLVNLLRGFQVAWQHSRKPSEIKRLVERNLLRYSGKRNAKTDKKEYAMRIEHHSFFDAFLNDTHQLPQTNFPLGIVKARNEGNIRYRIEYDFKWNRYNSNIKFNRVLKGNHTQFTSIQENIEIISNQTDDFTQSHCLKS